MKHLIGVRLHRRRVFQLLNVISVKRFCKVFLVLAIFLLIWHPTGADKLNQSLRFFRFKIPLPLTGLTELNSQWDSCNPWQTVGMGSRQATPLILSGTNIYSFKIRLPEMGISKHYL